MKIIGITEIGGLDSMYLKPDSALLVGGKPFFLPHFSEEIACRPCLVVRINRLGRCIEERFAYRYYDSIALGLNMQANNLMQVPYSFNSMMRAISFDNSLAVGDWLSIEGSDQWQIGTTQSEKTYHTNDIICSINSAISEISKYITIRMGDMVAIDFRDSARLLQREEEWRGKRGDTDVLYCKIK